MVVYKPIFMPRKLLKSTKYFTSQKEYVDSVSSDKGTVLLFNYRPEAFFEISKSDKYFRYFNLNKMQYFIPTTKRLFNTLKMLIEKYNEISILDIDVSRDSFSEDLIDMFNDFNRCESKIKGVITKNSLEIRGVSFRLQSIDIEIYPNGTFTSDGQKNNDKEKIYKVIDAMQRSLDGC